MYHPETLEPLVIPQVSRPLYDDSVIDQWLQSELYRETNPNLWKPRFDRFVRKHGQLYREGVLVRLLQDQAANVAKGNADLFKRQRLLLTRVLPGVRTGEWPALAAVGKEDQAVFIAALTLDRSKAIDEAVAALFREIEGKTEADDALALACARRLATRGYGPQLQAYMRKRAGKASPAHRAEMERLLGTGRG